MFLLDTDTVVYGLNGDPNVVNRMERHLDAPKAISAITYGELFYGATKSSRPIQNLAKVRQLRDILPIYQVTAAIMETFGTLKSELEERGQRLDDFDLVIAATALNLSYTLVTNNERHFSRVTNLSIENWTRGDP